MDRLDRELRCKVVPGVEIGFSRLRGITVQNDSGGVYYSTASRIPPGRFMWPYGLVVLLVCWFVGLCRSGGHVGDIV